MDRRREVFQDGRLRGDRGRRLLRRQGPRHRGKRLDRTTLHRRRKGVQLDEVPIAWLKYNEEELPLCYFVKDLIDDINWQNSVTADVLRDVAKFIYILRNYGGADLAEFLKDLKEHMAIKVTSDGGVDKLQAD